jgi:DNA-binding transcriptional regulator YbjK
MERLFNRSYIYTASKPRRPGLREEKMRRRQSNPHTFSENIAAEKAKFEAELAELHPGAEADALRKKLRQLDTAANLNNWLSSPGLQPPKRD